MCYTMVNECGEICLQLLTLSKSLEHLRPGLSALQETLENMDFPRSNFFLSTIFQESLLFFSLQFPPSFDWERLSNTFFSLSTLIFCLALQDVKHVPPLNVSHVSPPNVSGLPAASGIHQPQRSKPRRPVPNCHQLQSHTSIGFFVVVPAKRSE